MGRSRKSLLGRDIDPVSGRTARDLLHYRVASSALRGINRLAVPGKHSQRRSGESGSGGLHRCAEVRLRRARAGRSPSIPERPQRSSAFSGRGCASISTISEVDHQLHLRQQADWDRSVRGRYRLHNSRRVSGAHWYRLHHRTPLGGHQLLRRGNRVAAVDSAGALR